MPETNDYATKLEGYRKSIDKARTERITAEANKANLEKQQESIEAEVRALGVEPEQLDQTILGLETGIAGDLERLGELIPVEYRVG